MDGMGVARASVLLAVAFLVAVRGPHPATAQAVISGRVVGADGRPLAQASVHPDACPTVGAVTDSTGRFELTHAPPGRHGLVSELIGFRTDLRVVEVRGSEPIEVDFELEQATFDPPPTPRGGHEMVLPVVPSLLAEPDVAELLRRHAGAGDTLRIWAPWKPTSDTLSLEGERTVLLIRDCASCVAGRRWGIDWSGYEAATAHVRLDVLVAKRRATFVVDLVSAGETWYGRGRASTPRASTSATYVRQDDDTWARLRTRPPARRVGMPSSAGDCLATPGCRERPGACACTVVEPPPPRTPGRRTAGELAADFRAHGVNGISGVLTQQDSTYPRETLDRLADTLTAIAAAYKGDASSPAGNELAVDAFKVLARAWQTPQGQSRRPYEGAPERLQRIHREAVDADMRFLALREMLYPATEDAAVPYVRAYLRSADPEVPEAMAFLASQAYATSAAHALLRELYESGDALDARVGEVLTCHVWARDRREGR